MTDKHKGKLRESPFGWPLADEQCDDAFCWCKAATNEAHEQQQACANPINQQRVPDDRNIQYAPTEQKHVGAIKNVCGDGRCWCVQHWPTQYPGGMGIGGERCPKCGQTGLHACIPDPPVLHRRCECHECTQARAGRQIPVTWDTLGDLDSQAYWHAINKHQKECREQIESTKQNGIQLAKEAVLAERGRCEKKATLRLGYGESTDRIVRMIEEDIRSGK